MDFQSLLDSHLQTMRAQSLANSDQWVLGKLIQAIQEIVDASDCEDEADVYYDFGYLYPTTIDSWRGSYAELALDYEGYSYSQSKPMKASAFLQMLKEAVGKTFQGYKGGDFTMTINTPIWVANYSHSGNTAIVGVRDEGYKIVLLTGYCEY